MCEQILLVSEHCLYFFIFLTNQYEGRLKIIEPDHDPVILPRLKLLESLDPCGIEAFILLAEKLLHGSFHLLV